MSRVDVPAMRILSSVPVAVRIQDQRQRRADAAPPALVAAEGSRVASVARRSLMPDNLDVERIGPRPTALESGFASVLVNRADLRDRVLAVAAGVGDDVELVRAVTASYRATVASGLTPQAAVLLERAPQVWSLHRRPS
jgi:hypothetical protein